MEPHFHCIYVRIRRAIAKSTPKRMPASKVPLRVLVGTMSDIAKEALTTGHSKTRGTRAAQTLATTSSLQGGAAQIQNAFGIGSQPLRVSLR